MPHFNYVTDFGIEVGKDPAASASKFERLSGMLKDITGYQVDDHIDMKGTLTFNNFRLLVDVFPFKKKNWHITAGFYAGGRQVARAVNVVEDMPSLMAVSIYNNMYSKIERYMYEGTYGEGNDGLFMGVELTPTQYEKILDYGRMGMHVGDFQDQYELDYWGDPELDDEGNPIIKAYRMEPDENNMVKARLLVNKFRPYVGIGYEHSISKDGKTNLGFDCGVMAWGGEPSFVTHDGTDLIHDVHGIGGKVGRYVDVFSKFKAFPVLNLTISRRLF